MTPIAPSVLGAAHWMIAMVNGVDEATDFISRLVTCADEPTGSPVLALSKRANGIRNTSMRVHSRDLLAMVIKAWNYDATGRQSSSIALVNRTGEFNLPTVVKRKVKRSKMSDESDE